MHSPSAEDYRTGEEVEKATKSNRELIAELKARIVRLEGHHYPTTTEDFLNFIADRLVQVHGDGINTDFVLSLRTRAGDHRPGPFAASDYAILKRRAVAEARTADGADGAGPASAADLGECDAPVAAGEPLSDTLAKLHHATLIAAMEDGGAGASGAGAIARAACETVARLASGKASPGE